MLTEFRLNMFELCCHDKACLWQQRHVPLGPRRGQLCKRVIPENFCAFESISIVYVANTCAKQHSARHATVIDDLRGARHAMKPWHS